VREIEVWGSLWALHGDGAVAAEQSSGSRAAWTREKQEVDNGDLHSGGRRGGCTSGRRKQSREGRGAEGVQRKKEEKKSKGLCGILKNLGTSL
jgi:hypothetical protein